jgi:hypothetical protein
MTHKFPYKLFVPVYIDFMFYFLFAVVLFFMALYNPSALSWANPIIADLSPIMGSLHQISRVNINPFPRQVVHIYEAFCLFPLLLRNIYHVFFNKRLSSWFNGNMEKQYSLQIFSGKKIILASIALLLLDISYLLLYFFRNYEHLGRSDYREFSTNIISLSYMLAMSYSANIIIPLSALLLFFFLKKNNI